MSAPRAWGLTCDTPDDCEPLAVRPARGDWPLGIGPETSTSPSTPRAWGLAMQKRTVDEELVGYPGYLGIDRTHSECAEADEGFSRRPTACWGLRKGRGRCSGRGGRYLAKRCGASPGGQTGPPIPPVAPQHRCNSVGGSELLLAGGEGRRVNAV